MAGIAAVFHRNGDPVQHGLLRPQLEALASRGAPEIAAAVRDCMALGSCDLAPAAAGAAAGQALDDPRSAQLFAFEGRLDNRAELRAALPGEGGRWLSDADLARRAYDSWGSDCFARFHGPFAVVVASPEQRRVVCARDPLGSCALFYHLTPHRLIVASQEQAVVAGPAVPAILDDERLARHFAADGRAGGPTFFRSVSELLPGSVLEVGSCDVRSFEFWSADGIPRLEFRSEDECVEAFRELLLASVKARTHSPMPVAVMMSGGLDSTSVAALASRCAAGDAAPHAVSWTFERQRECDERSFIEPTIERLGIPWHPFVADDLWPLYDPSAFGCSPSSPEETPFRGLHQRAYSEARECGCRVVLNGGAADQLYFRQKSWLGSLLLARQWAAAAEDLRTLHRSSEFEGIAWTLRGALAEARGLWFPRPRAVAREWLTPRAQRLLSRPGARDGSRARRSLAATRMLDLLRSRGPAAETFHANRSGVEVRSPYRDLRLVEFMLGVPARYLFRPGRPKLLARAAMRDILPVDVVAPRPPTSLMPLFCYAIDGPARARVGELLFGTRARWQRWVDPGFIRRALASRARSELAGYILWQCVAFELWRQRHGYDLQ